MYKRQGVYSPTDNVAFSGTHDASIHNLFFYDVLSMPRGADGLTDVYKRQVHDHSLNAEGGDAAFRYGLTLRYKNAEGVMKNSGRQNIDGTVNLGYRIDRFNFSNQTKMCIRDRAYSVVTLLIER